MATSDFTQPFPVQFQGSAMARAVFALFGWSVRFDGWPTRQGVVIVYPHTSNWDFIVGIMAKWVVGVPVRFWGKDKLFRVPIFGRWLRWLGGIPVDRVSSHGLTGSTIEAIKRCKQEDAYFWLAVAPEGTRKHLSGLRSGFYRTAVGAEVPLCIARFDYQHREVTVVDFLKLTGNEAQDLERIARVLVGTVGCVPENAAPIVLLDASVPRSEAVVK